MQCFQQLSQSLVVCKPFIEMSPPITHSRARQVVCLLCFDKDSNARTINDNQLRLINEFFMVDYTSVSQQCDLIALVRLKN